MRSYECHLPQTMRNSDARLESGVDDPGVPREMIFNVKEHACPAICVGQVRLLRAHKAQQRRHHKSARKFLRSDCPDYLRQAHASEDLVHDTSVVGLPVRIGF